MTTTVTPRPHSATLIRDFTFPLPRQVRALPGWARVFAILLILSLIAIWVRTRMIGQQFWMDEGITVGISSHSLSAIPGVLRMDGSPPLFYMLLHLWMEMVGNGQAATRWLSEIPPALMIPLGYWAGHTIAGRRAALMSATLFAFNGFLDYYSVETRMYTLMALLALLATTGFINGFLYRRRRYVVLFALAQAAMFYTHAWSVYFAGGSFLSLVILWLISGEGIRKDLIKDALAAYIGAVILFIPWIPNFFFQATHTAAPWDNVPRFGFVIQIAVSVLGGGSSTVILLLAAGVGYAGLVVSRHLRLSREAKVLYMLVALTALTLALAWIGSHITPNWDVRYFAVIVPPIVLLLAVGMSRAGVIGGLAIVFTVCFMIRPSAFAPSYKSNMQDISGEVAGMLHRNDLVIVGQPEQTPLAYYYLPGGLRFANTIGPVKDPTYMNWVDALKRYRASDPYKVLPPMLNALRPGQQVLYIRPLTEGELNWKSPWTSLIRSKSAQWGAILQDDKQLRKEFWAPHFYTGAPDIADSAVLYRKR
ncbi:MAG: glycosyltransferase family 39 protein [Solirubrobacteraceae bacterium]